MNFTAMVDAVAHGVKLRRAVWDDKSYVGMVAVGGEDRLMIFNPTDSQLHSWTISSSDISATDWAPVSTPRPVGRVVRPEPLPAQGLDPTASPDPD